jgi:hypothetical protein
MTVCLNLRAELLRRAAKVQAGEHIDKTEQLHWFAALIACCDWPDRRLVGVDGAHAAFVLATRCPTRYLSDWLPAARSAVDRGDASKRQLRQLEMSLYRDNPFELAG